jgi:flavin-dependent dehydrogenase
MSLKDHYDVAIIGGGPAGSMAAIYLSRYEFDVCLIEKKNFPRDVLCGEFLSGEVTGLLKELKLFEEFLALNPVLISRFKSVNESGTEIHSNFSFPAYAVKRSLFDKFLLDEAINSGVNVYQPAEADFVRREDDKFVVGIIKQNNKENILVGANKVIAAYGKQNSFDKKLKRDFITSSSGVNGIKFHIPNSSIKNFSADEISIYTAENIYCGINTISENETTLCALEKRVNGKSSPRKRILKLLESNKNFGDLFKPGFENTLNDLPVYGTGNIYFGRRNVVENHIFMIGDAAGVIAPLAGDGIGMAFQSAKLISYLLSDFKKGKYSGDQLEKIYVMEWNKLFLRRIRFALFVQNLVLRRFTNKISYSFSKSFPSIMPVLIRATRSA